MSQKKNIDSDKAKTKEKIVITEKIDNKEGNINKLYFGFGIRLALNILLFISFLCFGTILLINSFKFETEKVIKYNEKSNLDYKVYLLENDFYEQDYLGKDMLYVASLIKNVGVDFTYNFNSEEAENIDFTYNIIGKLSITNESGTKSYFEKNYTLLENKTMKMSNNNNQTITEHLVIDYPYYNTLASGFKTQYGVNTNSKFTVYMIINKKNNDDSNFIMNSSNVMNLEIPLSEKAIDIKLDYKEINETNDIIEKQDVLLQSVLCLIISIIFIVISLIIMIKVMRKITLLFNKTVYDKYIKKILKEYDRLIAESSTLITFEDKEVIKIDKFSELLDIHDNLGLPIMYYTIAKHQKCYFYIHHDKTVYLNIVKATDLEKKKKHKKN